MENNVRNVKKFYKISDILNIQFNKTIEIKLAINNIIILKLYISQGSMVH